MQTPWGMAATRPERKAALQKMLKKWDRNGDGELNKVEFRQAIRGNLGVQASNSE